MKKIKSKWKTLRCVVEYRTDTDMSERNLAEDVQYILDNQSELTDSRPWAKSFSAFMGKLEGARPKRLQAAARAAETLAQRLRKM